ncbi:MAG: DUF1176 domain-containing protein [Rhodobacteraceae bacterium]|nr:DUF1176 domain-containing protein [Paracoccaceae bacterium]
MFTLLRLMALLVVLGQMSLAQDVGQSMRQWWVECDRQGYCSADTEGQTEDYETLTLRIERSAAANSPLLLELTPETLLGEGAAVRFDIPGVIEGIVRKVGPVSDNSFTTSEPLDSDLLHGVMTGETLFITIDFRSERGVQVFEVPLAGAIDSLTVMDIAQRRLGRRDAIVARGAAPVDSPSDIFPQDGTDNGPDGALPAGEGEEAAYVEVLYTPDELPAAVLEFGRTEADCGDPAGPLNEMGAIVNRDASGRTIFLIPCRIGQANVSYYIVLHDPANGVEYAMQRFELPPAHNAPDRATIMNPQWLAGRDRLVSTRYGNINLNCGSYEVHNWIAEQQRFELSVYRAKEDCTGPHVEPESFPLEWTLAEMGD